MERSTTSGRRRKTRLQAVSLPLLVSAISSFASAQDRKILLDQTLAVVGHRVILLGEVRAEAVVSSLLEKRRIPPAPQALAPEETEVALQTLIRRTVIANYLDNLGLVPEVPPERLAKMKSSLQALLGPPAEMKKYLEAKEISETNLDALLRSRIRSEMFAEQHLPFRVNVTEADVRAYYEAEKNRRFLGKPFDNVAPIVRADLRRERTKKEFETWLETEMHRTEVVLLNR